MAYVTLKEEAAFVKKTFGQTAVKLELSAAGIGWTHVENVNQSVFFTCKRELIGALVHEHAKNEMILYVLQKPSKKYEVRLIRLKLHDEEAAAAWVAAVQRVVNGLALATTDADFRHRRIFCLVNPFGGKKKALQIYNEHAKPLFAAANVQVTMTTTTHAAHATELASSLDLDLYDAIMVVSGDGLLWEVINGFMGRSDWRRAMRMPLSIVAGGTGNGLAASVGLLEPCAAVAAAIKGVTRPHDLSIIRQASFDRPRYSFIMMTWGFIADVDIRSERIRWMGGARFDVWGVKAVASNHRYRGRLAFLPVGDEQMIVCDRLDKCQACQKYHTAQGEEEAEEKGDEDEDDLVDNDADGVKKRATKKGAAARSKKFSKKKHVKKKVARGGSDDVDDDDDDDDDDDGGNGSSLPPSLVPDDFDFTNPPPKWEVVDDSFFMVCGSMVSWIGYNSGIAPYAHCSDQAIDLIYIRGASRAQLVNKLLQLESGKAFVEKNNFTEYRKVRAFIIEPLGDVGEGEEDEDDRIKGIVDVDGERIASERTVMEVLPPSISLNLCVKSWELRH